MNKIEMRISEILTEFYVATSSDKKLTTREIKSLEIERKKAIRAIIKVYKQEKVGL